MSSYPFDDETTAYAYIRANHEYGFGHVNLYMRLPELGRSYPDDDVSIAITSQCSEPRDNHDPEPFYAILMHADGHRMTPRNCERAGKAMRKLERTLAKVDTLAGAPAVLLEDYFVRVLRAARIQHVYCASRPNESASIPDMRRFTPEGFDSLHSQIRHLKRETLKLCGWFKEAA